MQKLSLIEHKLMKVGSEPIKRPNFFVLKQTQFDFNSLNIKLELRSKLYIFVSNQVNLVKNGLQRGGRNKKIRMNDDPSMALFPYFSLSLSLQRIYNQSLTYVNIIQQTLINVK